METVILKSKEVVSYFLIDAINLNLRYFNDYSYLKDIFPNSSTITNINYFKK